MRAVSRQPATPVALDRVSPTRRQTLSTPSSGAGTRLAGELLGVGDPVAELRDLVAVRELDTHALAHDTALRESFGPAEEGRELAVLAERRSAAVAWLARLVAAYRSTTCVSPRPPAVVPVPRPAVA